MKEEGRKGGREGGREGGRKEVQERVRYIEERVRCEGVRIVI